MTASSAALGYSVYKSLIIGYSQPRIAIFQTSEPFFSILFILTLCAHSPFSPAYTNYPNLPCSLSCCSLCYDTPWLRSCRYKPAAADNAPDGDAPSLPHKQDAQPWGETRVLCLPTCPSWSSSWNQGRAAVVNQPVPMYCFRIAPTSPFFAY